jgi:hypothetical protein
MIPHYLQLWTEAHPEKILFMCYTSDNERCTVISDNHNQRIEYINTNTMSHYQSGYACYLLSLQHYLYHFIVEPGM